MSLLTTFSVKNENTLQNNLCSSKNLTLQSNNKDIDKETKIIVYNIEKDFLIPMVTTPFMENTNMNNEIISAKFYNPFHLNLYGESLIIEKSDIYYEKVESFDYYTNLCEIVTVNELSVLYNIYQNLKKGNQGYVTLGKNLLLFNMEYDKGCEENIERNYKICNMFNNKTCQNFIFQYYHNNTSKDKLKENINYLILNCFLTYNVKQYHYYSVREIYNQFLNLVSFLKEIRCFINFNENYVLILPIFPSNCNTNNFLYNKSILFENNEEETENRTSNILTSQLIKLSDSFEEFYQDCGNNRVFIDTLYVIIVDLLHNPKIFDYLIKIFRLAYMHYISKNYFYSNIAILLIYQYVAELLNRNQHQSFNNLFFVSNLEDLEDDALFTEAIRQQICNDSLHNNLSIFNYLSFYYEDSINYYLNNILKNGKSNKIMQDEKDILNLEGIKNQLLKYLKTDNFNNKECSSHVISSFIYFYKMNLSSFSKIEIRNENTRQIWLLEQISPLSKFEKQFIVDQILIPNFFTVTHIIPYILFHKYCKQNCEDSSLLYDKRKHIIKIQAVVKGHQVRELFLDLKKKVTKIVRYYKKYYFRKISKMDFGTLCSLILNKYGKKDFAVIKMVLNIQSTLKYLQIENFQLKNKIKTKRNIGPLISNNSSVTSSESNNCYFYTTSTNTNGEINNLQEKIKEIMKNYNELLLTGEKYINKFSNIVSLMKSNNEVKSLLLKNGITIN